MEQDGIYLGGFAPLAGWCVPGGGNLCKWGWAFALGKETGAYRWADIYLETGLGITEVHGMYWGS